MASAAGVASELSQPDPARIVASIYANGQEDGVRARWHERVGRGKWFSHALTVLSAQGDANARKTGDELGALEFDVATNSQGLEVKRLTVKTLSRDRGTGSPTGARGARTGRLRELSHPTSTARSAR